MQLHGHKICIFTSDMQGLIWGEPELYTYFCDVKQNHVSHECGVVLKVKGNQLPLADLTYNGVHVRLVVIYNSVCMSCQETRGRHSFDSLSSTSS